MRKTVATESYILNTSQWTRLQRKRRKVMEIRERETARVKARRLKPCSHERTSGVAALCRCDVTSPSVWSGRTYSGGVDVLV